MYLSLFLNTSGAKMMMICLPPQGTPPHTAADMAHNTHSTQPALQPHRTTPRAEDKPPQTHRPHSNGLCSPLSEGQVPNRRSGVYKIRINPRQHRIMHAAKLGGLLRRCGNARARRFQSSGARTDGFNEVRRLRLERPPWPLPGAHAGWPLLWPPPPRVPVLRRLSLGAMWSSPS